MKERKAFKKNKGLVKRLFSFVLALALVLNMGQIMPGSTVNAAGSYNATIHYLNNTNWSEVGFYAWGNAGNLGAWPGTLVQENADHEGWYDGVVTNFGESKINVIFNENGKGGQTKDLSVDLTAGEEFWVVNEQVLTTAPEAWSGNVVVEPERYNATIHYLNNNGWGEVGFYAWGNAGNLGAWPGALVQENADHEGWYDGVVTNFGESTIKVIFNENGKGGQTDDLVVDLTAGEEFWVVDGNVLTTAPENWDKAPEEELPEVEPTTYDATIHYHNMYNWDTVAFYSWGEVTPAPAWPGSVILENTEKEGWYTATVTDFKESTIKVIFNNNNNGGQTADLVVDLTIGEEFWVYNGEVFATAPNAWTGEGEIEKPYELVFHYYDQMNYGAVNFYSWTAGTNAGSWPGVAMEKNADHTGWFDYKVVGVTAASIDFILDHANGQTDNLNVDISGKPAEVWVTGELQKGKAIAISTEAPEGWVEIEEDPTYSASIHYLNSDEWSTVSFYAWGSDNIGFVTWPGKAISENADHEGWFDATVETKETSIGVIFNNGGNGGQTGDLTVDLTAGDEFWVMYGTVYTEAPNAWTGEGEVEEPEFEEITFHYENKNGWSVVNFYSWTGGTNAGSWPGVAMTPNEEKLGWYDFTVRNITASSIDFIMNNGSAQTDDLNVDISGKPSDIWVSGYYNNPVISTTAPESWTNPGEVVEMPSAYNVVVHYNNPNNWTDVSFYSWNSGGNAIVGAWPGKAATVNAANTGWYDFYLNGLTDNIFNFIWNGTGGQTSDLIYTLTEENTELWVSGESISTTAPAGWTNTYAVQFHYNNPNSWSNVALYTWDANDVKPTGAWPGSATTANEINEGWCDYYLAGVTSATLNFIFNGTGGQTSDLSYSFTKPYTELWVVGQTVKDEAPEEWSTKAPVKERDVYVPGTLPGPAWDAASNKMTYLGNGIYSITFENLPAANYEYKIAIGGSWDENYGANGAGNGGNIKLVVPYAQDVTIYYSDVTHFAVDTINYIFADITLSGTNVPEGTKLTDEGLTGIYNATVKLPAGTYTDLKLEYNGVTYTFSKFTLAKEKEVTFCMDPLSGLFYHDGSATKVKASALYFDSKSTEYKSVFGAVATGEEVKFSITTGDDVTSASLFFKGMENKAIAMSKDGEVVNGKQKWSVTTSLSAIGEYDYYFAVSNGADVCVYGDDDG